MWSKEREAIAIAPLMSISQIGRGEWLRKSQCETSWLATAEALRTPRSGSSVVTSPLTAGDLALPLPKAEVTYPKLITISRSW
jgi:hypothetical protein